MPHLKTHPLKIARLLLCVSTLLTLALPGNAVVVSPYKGLDPLIKEADVIAIVRLESAPTLGIIVDGWAYPDCFVYQTLKGTLKTDMNYRVLLGLNGFVGTRTNFDGDFLAPMSTHLVFLRHSEKAINGANYFVICREGADLPLSPLGNEKKPTGKTLKEQTQTLVRRYQAYRNEQTKAEDELLDKTLAD